MKKNLKKELEQLLDSDVETLQAEVDVPAISDNLFVAVRKSGKDYELYVVQTKNNLIIKEQILYKNYSMSLVMNKLNVLYEAIFRYPNKSLDEILIATGFKK